MSLYWNYQKLNNVRLGVDDGELEVKFRNTEAWGSTASNYDCTGGCLWGQSSSNTEKSGIDMYELGWNFLWFTSGSNWNYISFPHFQGTPRTSSDSNTNTYAHNRLMIGAERRSTISKEFEGIIHSIRIVSTEYTATQIK